MKNKERIGLGCLTGIVASFSFFIGMAANQIMSPERKYIPEIRQKVDALYERLPSEEYVLRNDKFYKVVPVDTPIGGDFEFEYVDNKEVLKFLNH